MCAGARGDEGRQGRASSRARCPGRSCSTWPGVCCVSWLGIEERAKVEGHCRGRFLVTPFDAAEHERALLLRSECALQHRSCRPVTVELRVRLVECSITEAAKPGEERGSACEELGHRHRGEIVLCSRRRQAGSCRCRLGLGATGCATWRRSRGPSPGSWSCGSSDCSGGTRCGQWGCSHRGGHRPSGRRQGARSTLRFTSRLASHRGGAGGCGCSGCGGSFCRSTGVRRPS